MPYTNISGLELKARRIAADVLVNDLAEAMGIKPSGVSSIESRRRVTQKAHDRYVAALATFATSQTARDGQDAA